jgi:hypothetical protein
MGSENMGRPGQLVPGKAYWLCSNYFNGGRFCQERVQRVVFSSYRAHPGEVVVRIDSKSVVVARKDIFIG